MNIIKEDLFKYVGKGRAILVTTNQVLNRNGDLVMGAGAAKAAALRWPQLPRMAAMSRHSVDLVFQDTDGTWVGIFPTKKSWKDPADVKLIRKSIKELNFMAIYTKDIEFHVNMPGIGLGGLSYQTVENLIKELLTETNIYFHVK